MAATFSGPMFEYLINSDNNNNNNVHYLCLRIKIQIEMYVYVFETSLYNYYLWTNYTKRSKNISKSIYKSPNAYSYDIIILL